MAGPTLTPLVLMHIFEWQYPDVWGGLNYLYISFFLNDSSSNIQLSNALLSYWLDVILSLKLVVSTSWIIGKKFSGFPNVLLLYYFSLFQSHYWKTFQLVAWACYSTCSFCWGAITCEIYSYKSSCRISTYSCGYMEYSERFIYWRATWGSLINMCSSIN